MTSQQASTNNPVSSELQQDHGTQGYNRIKAKISTLASVLEDSAVLIGSKQSSTVNLKLGGVFNQSGLNLLNESENLSKYAHDIRQGIFKVIVLGEFKQGKSTLLNAILGTKTLPAKATPTTAIITVLVYGSSKNVLIYETGKDTPRNLSWDDFTQEFKLTIQDIELLDKEGYLDRFKDIEYALIECSNTLCENGVRLIDSPGLGEQASRTKLSTGYLEKSQAVIFVLNATQILGDKEVEFIETKLGSGRLENVFFVVNYINRIEDEEGVDEVKDWVCIKLRHHFFDKNGQFDEDLYKRRVFFVNAKGALDAKISGSEATTQLNDSGVPALEKELEIFLTSDAKDAVALEETLKKLHGIIQTSRDAIDDEKIRVEQPIALLEKNRMLAEEKLKELENEKLKIETTISRFGEVIGGKLFGNLMLFVNELKDTWDTDSKTLMNIDEVGFWTILKSSVSGGAKEKIKTVIEREVDKYLQEKLRQWAEQIPTLIQEDTERMKAELEIKLEDFQKGLAQVNSIFSTGKLLGSYELDTEKGKFSKAVQGFVNVLFLDPSGLTGTLMGGGNWGSFLMRSLTDLFIFGVVSSIATPIVGFIVYAILELIHMGIQQSSFKDRLLNTIGEKVHATLPTEMAKQQDAIRQKVQQQFNSSARHLTDKLQAEIDQIRTRQHQLIEEMRQESFSAEQEKMRLDAISRKLAELFYIAGQASGKTPAEVAKLLGDEISFTQIQVNV